MNKHRLYRKSKKIQGRGFFTDFINVIGKEIKSILEEKSKDFVAVERKEKLNEIFSKKKMQGAGLKFFYPK